MRLMGEHFSALAAAGGGGGGGGSASGVASVFGRLWGAPATLLDDSWPLLARPEGPRIGLGAASAGPRAVLSASGRVPETALGAYDGPKSMVD